MKSLVKQQYNNSYTLWKDDNIYRSDIESIVILPFLNLTADIFVPTDPQFSTTNGQLCNGQSFVFKRDSPISRMIFQVFSTFPAANATQQFGENPISFQKEQQTTFVIITEISRSEPWRK